MKVDKPCPFCGGELEIIPCSGKYYFACNGCFIESRISVELKYILQHANERWDNVPKT